MGLSLDFVLHPIPDLIILKCPRHINLMVGVEMNAMMLGISMLYFKPMIVGVLMIYLILLLMKVIVN